MVNLDNCNIIIMSTSICIVIYLICYCLSNKNKININTKPINCNSSTCSIENFNLEDERKPSKPEDNEEINISTLSQDVPTEKHLENNCDDNKVRNVSDRCIRNRIADKYNLASIRGGQGLYVNIDGELIYDPENYSNKWNNNKNTDRKFNPDGSINYNYTKKREKKTGCLSEKEYTFYNMPEHELDKNKIEFSDYLADNERVKKSFKIHCPEKEGSVNDYYSRYMMKRKENKIDSLKRKWHNRKEQDKVNNAINGINYETAEQYYKRNYAYDISPLNTVNFYLPSNYTEYSQYNNKKLDKILKDMKIPQSDKYKTRAFNWHFGME